jgi:exodeoxyribonuclease V alpha subunit
MSENMYEQLFERLGQSKFRSRFKLTGRDRDYVALRKREVIAAHAREIIAKRLAPAQPLKDGKQTPYRGHPVFIAQHATATCCRSCLEKWHDIPKGAALTSEQQDYVVDVILAWIYRSAAR